MSRTVTRVLLALGFLFSAARAVAAENDPYLDYVRQAPEFQSVKQDPAMMIGRWNTWVYMPWRYQWTIGTGDEGGQFCKDYGFNGGFTDHGQGPLDWLEKWQLRFYNDHTAAKGYLYLQGANSKGNFKKYQNNARAVRSGLNGPQPIDDAMLQRLRTIVTRNVNNVKKSPMRVAYALDDEISWGAFVVPISWRVNDDDEAYEKWLKSYYGGTAPKAQYVTYDFVLPQLNRPLGQIDMSPFLDRISYNDSVWANFLGQLVECANQADPETPCGFVGGQAPGLWGGYDYAKLMKKIQFIEAYDMGSSQAVCRSFSPHNAVPLVTTHFHSPQRGTANDIWQSWYYFAHGNRGMIGWVEGWFDGKTPRPWLADYKATLKELGGVQGPKTSGARWLHDGVALYYSHPSIQVSWCLDAEAHRKTWVNRGNDARLGTSHNVRKAWEHILTDSGIQYNFIPYDKVIAGGVPAEYRVLILPACYALSDIEAKRIEEFCRQGGTVIADFGCGLFDQHGKGRSRGCTDELFGVRHDGSETKADFFAGKLWVETDQDSAFSFKRYRQLFATLDSRLQEGFAVAERKLPVATVRQVGKGKAVYLNLSPQRYLQYREEGTTSDAHRKVFAEHVLAAGVTPRVKVTSGASRPRNCEVTYWSKAGRTLMFIVQSAAVSSSEVGGGGAEGLGEKVLPLDVEFPSAVADVVDERSGKKLGDGSKFSFQFRTAEAVFLSFKDAATPAGK
jgi:hypothetical protein